jgi:FeS assembly SUF system protein
MDDNRAEHDPVVDLGHRPALDPAGAVEPPVPPPTPHHVPKSLEEGGTPVPGSKLSAEELDQLTADIVTALKTVFDPEIPADIYELGLIYKVDIKDDRSVDVEMTLTTPNCPAAGELPTMVENAVASVAGVGPVNVNVVWEPMWTPDRMSDEARLVLNMW